MATHNENMQHTRWCYTMAGEEFARIHSWGNDPARHGDYEAASPCQHSDLPQTLLEPILLRYATRNGFVSRFDSTFLKFAHGEDGTIRSTIRDNVTNAEYTVRSKYLFGCDGARSQVIRQLGLPLIKAPGSGEALALNVLVDADLRHLMEHRTGNLHWVMQPDKEHPDFCWTAIVRMVKPWHEYVSPLFSLPTNPNHTMQMGLHHDPLPRRRDRIQPFPRRMPTARTRVHRRLVSRRQDSRHFQMVHQRNRRRALQRRQHVRFSPPHNPSPPIPLTPIFFPLTASASATPSTGTHPSTVSAATPASKTHSTLPGNSRTSSATSQPHTCSAATASNANPSAHP